MNGVGSSGPKGETAEPGSIDEWMALQVDNAVPLMGTVLTSDAKVMLYGPSGKGKTAFMLTLAAHVAAGCDFLHWKGSQEPRRTLYIDGEMGVKQMQLRLKDVLQRLQMRPQGLRILSRNQYPDMPPLDTPEGQLWLDIKIEEWGGFDLIIFDNFQSLCEGSLIGEESWKRTLPWALSLQRRKIGPLWVHHTGTDTSHEYGTSTRRWGMDTVIKLEPLLRAKHLAVALKFDKARDSWLAPADFETVQVELADNKWVSSGGEAPKASRVELIEAVLIKQGHTSPETKIETRQLAEPIDPNDVEAEVRRLYNNQRTKAYHKLCSQVGGRWFWYAAGE